MKGETFRVHEPHSVSAPTHNQCQSHFHVWDCLIVLIGQRKHMAVAALYLTIDNDKKEQSRNSYHWK